MATDTGILEIFDVIVENAKLTIQLAYKAQDPCLINQENAELCERFAAYRTALAQMTDQGSEMVSLPQGVKSEKPKCFTGVIDTDVVSAFIFQVEQYFTLINKADAN